MKYLIDGEEFTDISEAVEHITNQISEDEYNEMLDECYPQCEICGCTFTSSYALYELDPIAYRCGMCDYIDSRREDIANTLDSMHDGDEDYICGCNVEAVEDEEEEEEEEED